jgi:hypothetical protein
VLTDDTVTKDDKGLLGLDKKQLSSVVLIPGLKSMLTEHPTAMAGLCTLDRDSTKREETNGGESSSNHDC